MSEDQFDCHLSIEIDWFLVCGLGSLGQHCVNALAEFRVKVIGIEQLLPLSWEIDCLPDLLENLVIGDCRQNNILNQAKIEQCRAALVVTGNEQVNIETALAIRQLNAQTRLVVRSGKENLNQLLSQQLGNFIAFEPTELTIPAFVLAALGTNILGFFPLNGQILQVYQRPIKKGDPWCNRRLSETEYHIEANDTLEGLLLADIAYGYGVITVWYQKPHQTPIMLPADELRLSIGDLLVVLATIEGLRRIEQGRLNLELKCWRIRIEKALTPDAIFEGANALARISGCSLILARNTMENLPQTLPTLLYKHQAQYLVRELKKTLVVAHLLSDMKSI